MEGSHPLKVWREANSLNQEEAAAILGTTKPTISRLETGARTPSLTLAAKLSEHTGISIDSFVRRTAA